MAYIGSSPTKVVSRQSANIFTYTATANQTAFTGTDANGNTLACTPSDIMVHMNGLRLEESDFTASTTTVTLGSGTAAGDEVTITAFVTFETADAYTKSAADARYVNVTGGNITGDLTVDTDTLKVDSSNDRVLINTTTEGRDSEGADILTIAAPDDGHSGITVRSGTSSYGSLYFSDATSGAGEYAGSMQFNHSNNQLALGVAGSDYLKIDSSGHVTKPNNPWLNVQGAGGWISFAVGENQLTNIYTSSTVYQNTGGGFNRSNATYTAPVAGRYCFMWNTYTKGVSNNASTADV